MSKLSTSAELLLDQIEAIELRSLSWGYADGSMTLEEAAELLGDQSDVDAEEVLEELLSAKLIFEWQTPSGQVRIRSRFAEYVRLTSRLKQLFPAKPWSGAPRLVTDFRVDIRRRRYPSRDQSAELLAERHSKILGSPDLRRDLWQALAVQPGLTLSGFQERSIERLLASTSDTATIVTAGTGSGKTLAFYLPALLRIGERIEAQDRWVKVLAIYPRKELLKDQLAEAYRRARVLDSTLMSRGKRRISIGALFSSTPSTGQKDALERAGWPHHPLGFTCPWLKCTRCGSDLVWLDNARSKRIEKLICSDKNCGTEISDDQLVLTRERLVRSPPDLLFTTTEMLNQRLSDLRMRPLFGVGVPPQRRPLMALLDEVHTYEGSSGAQAALVLRRWRHLLDSPIVWAGLSATLAQADRFFSELTGVPQERVVEVTPHPDEMTEEGAEYQLILKGDPTLQASLLSSTIQAAMLCARMLEPERSNRHPYFGRRVFVFTDDLDVTNRLFDNIRDAEGYSIFGKDDASKRPLSALRGPEPKDPRRDADGQRWWACERLERDLEDKLIVGRTSSQDAGVLANADIVVATATLEVGYNDDQVGAVIQHKAPRSVASFLQRKGRAGRIRGMRPVTVTLLSEYGRDRVTFQAYEHLFSPSLTTQHLPIENQYLLRMQAVFSMIDWLADTTSGVASQGWMWDLLSRPGGYAPDALKKAVQERLNDLINGKAAAVHALKRHLCASLQISEATCDAILWEPPRALLMEAIPTLARRFLLSWKLVKAEPSRELDFKVDYHPLPDFIPRNLFSDLNLPEVQVLIPPATQQHKERQEAMPILQALRQFAPGRVTRRFAFERGNLFHWVPVDPGLTDQVVKVHEFASEIEQIGVFKGQDADGGTVELPVYRPWVVRLGQVNSKKILPTSNSTPTWCSGFVPLGDPLVVDIPPKSGWAPLVRKFEFYLHRFRSSIAVRRFTPQANATLREKTGETLVRVTYSDADGAASALGFELEVDGFCLDLELPKIEELLTARLPGEIQASCHSAYVRNQLLSDAQLPREFNSLQREWLFQIWMAASIQRAAKDDMSVAEASRAILKGDPARTFAQALKRLFEVQAVELGDEESADEEDVDATRLNIDAGSSKESRLEERLQHSIANPEVIARLLSLSDELSMPDPQRYGSWLVRTLHETLAEAILQACIDIAPRRTAVDTLLVDIEVHGEQRVRVWVTESTMGGAGVVAAFAETFAADPRSLLRAIEAALAPGDLELSTDGLDRFVDLLLRDPVVANLTEQVRLSTGHAAREHARAALYEALAARDLDVGRSLSVSLNARLLRSTSTSKLDDLLNRLVQEWKALEQRFSLSISLREFCSIAVDLKDVRSALTEILTDAGRRRIGDGELIGVLGGLMWPRGLDVRQRALQSYNPFRHRKLTDPALVRMLLLQDPAPQIHVEKATWYDELADALRSCGTAQLIAPLEASRSMRQALVQALGRPIDMGFLQFFPVVERVQRSSGRCLVTVAVREQT